MKRCDICGELKGENEFTMCDECSVGFGDQAEAADISHQDVIERPCAEAGTCEKCGQKLKHKKLS